MALHLVTCCTVRLFAVITAEALVVLSAAVRCRLALNSPTQQPAQLVFAVEARNSQNIAVLLQACPLLLRGPAYAYMVLRLAYGRRWSETEAPTALAVYSVYICLLAVNGILLVVSEAFQHALAKPKELGRPNAWLIAISAAHLDLSVGAVGMYGNIGLIWAAGADMALRIAHSLAFAQQYFGGNVSVFIPESKDVGCICNCTVLDIFVQTVGFGCCWSINECKKPCPIQGFWTAAVYHVTLGGLTLVLLAAFVYRTQQQLWGSLLLVHKEWD